MDITDPIEAFLNVPPYVGDDAFRSHLKKHGCATRLEVIRMRFLGAAVTPGREADVGAHIEEFFDYEMPDFDGPGLIDFYRPFIALYREIAAAAERPFAFELTPLQNAAHRNDIVDIVGRRGEEVNFGFLDGIWGEDLHLPLSRSQAAALTALDEAVHAYDVLRADIDRGDSGIRAATVEELRSRVAEIDQEVAAAMNALLEDFRTDASSEHAMMARAQTLVGELAFSKELPREAIRQCIDRRDEMVPVFLDILRDYTLGRPLTIDRERAIFLIVHILGELGEQTAFAPLTDMLACRREGAWSILGDATTESLQKILISVFDGDVDRLRRLMENAEAYEYFRYAAFGAWTYFVATGRIDRADAERFLSDALKMLRPQDEHLVWYAWAEAVARLGFTDLKGRVRNAFDLGWISTEIMTFDKFEDAVDRASRSGDLVAFIAAEDLYPFTDTIGVLSTWHRYSEEYLRERKKVEQQPSNPFTTVEPASNPYRDVGRNDPCPCGSGKKFKKCCLQ